MAFSSYPANPWAKMDWWQSVVAQMLARPHQSLLAALGNWKLVFSCTPPFTPKSLHPHPDHTPRFCLFLKGLPRTLQNAVLLFFLPHAINLNIYYRRFDTSTRFFFSQSHSLYFANRKTTTIKMRTTTLSLGALAMGLASAWYPGSGQCVSKRALASPKYLVLIQAE